VEEPAVSLVTNHLDQPMLRGTFAPVADELDVASLAVTGELPPGLEGRFVRNGPNPMFEPIGRYHMFDGDGMLHQLTIRDGQVDYRNRWIRTPALLAEQRAGRALYGGVGAAHWPSREEVGDAGPVKNPANTNTIFHAGRHLALWEGGLPTEVTAELDTVGPYDFGGRLRGAFTAHPRIDARTGELFAFAYLPSAPHLRAYHVSASGELVSITDIERPECPVMHDFVITDHHVVFVESPLTFDLPSLLGGGEPFRWKPDAGSRVGVMPRAGGEVRWIEVDDGYINHFWNAWEHDGVITFSGSRVFESAFTTEAGGAADREGADAEAGRPTRYLVDLGSGRATAEQLDDLGGDFPRINDAWTGTRTRYRSMSAFSGAATAVGHFDGIVQYDDETGTRVDWWAGPGMLVGEAVFAADPDGSHENDGWLLATVHDRSSGDTDLAVIDARDVGTGPVARVHLPRRLPFGFHASWFVDHPAPLPPSDR
jgi:carotenoid cleavage dioxygenase